MLIEMNFENKIAEILWSHAGYVIYLPIAAAIIIIVINVYMLFPAKQEELKEVSALDVEEAEARETLYIEETRFSRTEILLQELNQDEPSSGYLVTEEMVLLAQLIQAEAGNQDLTGKRLVADVVLNRVDDERFPDTVEEVIFQKNPVQFGVTVDGAFERAGSDISEECFEAVRIEWERETRLDKDVLYFNTEYENGKNPFRHGGHWFSY